MSAEDARPQLTRLQSLLTTCGEEAVEVAQRCSKALRFGLHQTQLGQPHDNATRIIREFTELVAVMEMADLLVVSDLGCVRVNPVLVAAKKEKVEAYLADIDVADAKYLPGVTR